MSQTREEKLIWNEEQVQPGETREFHLTVGQSFSGVPVDVPILVSRSNEDGPTVFVSAALHGDEINGTGAVRQLIKDQLPLLQGAMIFVPVLNILGFERHSRYMPDRRDLNRSFPGASTGSSTCRVAKRLIDEIVRKSDFGIDIHTAAKRRTNYPNIRANMKNPEVRRIAHAFGCEIILDGAGPKGSFRRESCNLGCPTVVMEGGEVSKVEPGVVEAAVRGVKNVLVELGMLEGPRETPNYQFVIETSKWIRAEQGGFLNFHVKPGDVVTKDQALATNTSLLGNSLNTLYSPFDAVVIGMSTLPAISPGEPVCHLGKLAKGTHAHKIHHGREKEDALESRLVEELASNVLVIDPDQKSQDQ